MEKVGNIMESNSIPDFAIVQNSRTKVSGIWTKNGGRWVQAQESEYEILRLLSQLIRTSKNPIEVLDQLESYNKKEE